MSNTVTSYILARHPKANPDMLSEVAYLAV